MTVAIVAPLAVDAIADLLAGEVPPVRAVAGGTPIAHLVRGLVERGRDVAVVTAELGRTEPAVLSGPGLEVRLCPYRTEHRARDLFAYERSHLVAALEAVRPTVVHAHWTYEFALAALAHDPDALVTVRDWAPMILRYQTDPYRGIRLFMNTMALARSRHVTATSRYMQRRIERWTRRSVALIPNAISDEDFLPRDAVAQRSAAEPPTIVSINNGFGRRKNVTTLLAAWPTVRRARPDAGLVLIGNGYDVSGEAARWATENGLDEGVRFAGPLPNADAMAELSRAAALVHPSREESFGLTLVEAMARGVAVVGGRTSGAVPDLLDGGRAGVLVDVTDQRQLADAMVGILTEPERDQRRRALLAYDHAWDRFRLSRALDGYEARYRALGWRP